MPEFDVHWESLGVQNKAGDEVCNKRDLGRTGKEKPPHCKDGQTS